MKELVLEALQKDSNQYGKMEKADILEMTANYLKTLRGQLVQQHQSNLRGTDGYSSYQAGYQHCAAEVSRYLATNSDLNQLRAVEISQSAMLSYPMAAEMASPVPSPTGSTQVFIARSHSPQAAQGFYNDALVRQQYSPPSSPDVLCQSPESIRSQFRYPTPPPSPSSPQGAKQSKPVSAESTKIQSTNKSLWRPWC